MLHNCEVGTHYYGSVRFGFVRESGLRLILVWVRWCHGCGHAKYFT